MVAAVLCGADRTIPFFSEITLSVCTMYRYSLGKSYLNSVNSVNSVISLFANAGAYSLRSRLRT